MCSKGHFGFSMINVRLCLLVLLRRTDHIHDKLSGYLLQMIINHYHTNGNVVLINYKVPGFLSISRYISVISLTHILYIIAGD